MQIYISSDHGGFELKQELTSWLTGEFPGSQVEDLGPAKLDPEDDYPRYAFPLAEKVVKNPGSIGILICRSGIGMTIAANKVRGARAALCFSLKHATKAVEDDRANILVLDADYMGLDAHKQVVQAFLNSTPKTEQKYVRRVEEISAYETQK